MVSEGVKKIMESMEGMRNRNRQEDDRQRIRWNKKDHARDKWGCSNHPYLQLRARLNRPFPL